MLLGYGACKGLRLSSGKKPLSLLSYFTDWYYVPYWCLLVNALGLLDVRSGIRVNCLQLRQVC